MSNDLLKEISVIEAEELFQKGALLVDVRENDEVKAVAYNVPNLLHIPLSEFENRFEEVPNDRNVIMVCRSGKRSYSAAVFLLTKGYTNVVNMDGGILSWMQYGLPVKDAALNG